MGHRCKKRELSVLLIEEEDEDGTDYSGSEPPMSPTLEPNNESSNHPEVSLNSVIGLSNPKTMKMCGSVKGKDVVVMINPGATHNFISLEFVEELGIVVDDAAVFGVSLGNGDAIKGKGLCKNVELIIDGRISITVDMLPLELGNLDIILGVQWLETLGTVINNWKTQVMQFEAEGQNITLVGDASLVRSQVSMKAIIRKLRKVKEGFYVELNVVEKTGARTGEGDEKEEVPECLQQIIKRYESVFDVPKGLPPPRGHKHAIVLKEGSNPVGFRPYRYPQSQKDEIEKLIKEMLGAGIIKPSNISYSSPVLLVKKT